MSKLITNETIYCFDIDETLACAYESGNELTKMVTIVKDPYSRKRTPVTKHQRHIDLLKQMKGRGRFIIAWSAAGALWAQAVIEALGLETSVDLVMTKPLGYVDDKHVTEWMQNHIYLEDYK